jgi:hypothetical protein
MVGSVSSTVFPDPVVPPVPVLEATLTALESAADALVVAVEMRVDWDVFWLFVVDSEVESREATDPAFESAIAASAAFVEMSDDWARF